MDTPHLIIGNKNYSSWSFRPWLAMRQTGIAFKETVSPFDEASHNQHFLAFSPVKKVPVLEHGSLKLWESLAIMEYVADCYPQAGLWPQDIRARAVARVLCNEMHAGFTALRVACPMNMRRRVDALDVDAAVRKDVERIEHMWREALQDSGGPFLMGTFTNVDAMFAPVVNRFHVYVLSRDSDVRAYMEHMMALKSWSQWQDAARAESWVVEEEEI